MDNIRTIPELLGSLTKRHKSKLLFQRRDGWSWKQITWLDFDSDVKNLASFLLTLDFDYGDSALFVSANCNECLISELAVYSLGGKVVPFSDFESLDKLREPVENEKPKFVFVENQQYAERLKELENISQNVNKIFVFDDSKVGEDEKIVPYKAAIKFGQLKKREISDRLKEVSQEISPDMQALGIYSGNADETVKHEYSHKEVVQFINNAADELRFVSTEDQSFSYIHSSGLYEKLINLLAISLGMRVIISENDDCYYQDIVEAKPTVVFDTKAGIEKRCQLLNGSDLKKTFGGRVKYLITDLMPNGTSNQRLRGSNIKIIPLTQLKS